MGNWKFLKVFWMIRIITNRWNKLKNYFSFITKNLKLKFKAFPIFIFAWNYNIIILPLILILYKKFIFKNKVLVSINDI